LKLAYVAPAVHDVRTVTWPRSGKAHATRTGRPRLHRAIDRAPGPRLAWCPTTYGVRTRERRAPNSSSGEGAFRRPDDALLSEPDGDRAVGLPAKWRTAARRNAILFAVQIDITPPELQGRVISAAMLTVGITAPLGSLLGGLLLDHAGQAPTFLAYSALVAALTVTMHVSTAIRTMRRPGEN
jgi:hypothetical protein